MRLSEGSTKRVSHMKISTLDSTLMLRSAVLTALFCSLTLAGQPIVQESKAELSGPLGTVNGRVIFAGEQITFIADANNQASIVVPRTNVRNLSVDGNTVTIELGEAVRVANGEISRLTFRLGDEQAAAAAPEWYKRAAANGTSSATDKSFPAQHKRRFGDSRGRLLITSTGIAYESIDDVDDSRRWRYEDIKELKLKNPYELEIEPFSGGGYTLALEGQGMNTSDYQEIVDRVTRTRVGK
jgi:hypothetical protein